MFLSLYLVEQYHYIIRQKKSLLISLESETLLKRKHYMTRLVHGYQIKLMNALLQNLNDCQQIFRKLEACNLKALVKLKLTVS